VRIYVFQRPAELSPLFSQANVCLRSSNSGFTERTLEDAKTENGWDAFQAQEDRAGEPPLALTATALGFVAQTQLECRGLDPELARAGRRGCARPFDRQRAQVIEGSVAQPSAHARTGDQAGYQAPGSAGAFDQEPFEAPRATPRPTLL